MADQISSRPARTADGVRRASLRSTTWAMDSPLRGRRPTGRRRCETDAAGRRAQRRRPFPPWPSTTAAADRVIDALRQRSALPVDGQEPHAIGMRAGLDRAQQAAEIEQMRLFLEIDDVGPGERQAQPWRIRARRGSTSSGSMRSGRQPSRPSITALSVRAPLAGRAQRRTARPAPRRPARPSAPGARRNGWRRSSDPPCASWRVRCRS